MTRPMTDDELMPFGVHKGQPMKDVPASYLDWLRGRSWVAEKWPRLKAYIDLNSSVIDLELEERE